MRSQQFIFDSAAFAARLKLRMSELSINQNQLSELTGLGQSTLSRYANAKQAPEIGPAVAIAKALECDLGWLVGLDVPEKVTAVGAEPPPGSDYIRLPERDPRPLNPPERAALEKALVVLRAQGARGDPDVALFSNIECFYQNVEAAGLGAQRGVRQPVEGTGTASSAKRNSAR